MKSIHDFRFEDFSLTDYDPHPAIKAPIAIYSQNRNELDEQMFVSNMNVRMILVRRLNMHQRSELEQPRTPAEMQTIIDTFANDHAAYPSTEVRRRAGISKVVIEEYLPLLLLAQNIPGVRSASLTTDSNPGPDAVLLFDDGSRATVQITCAGENESTALQRELLNDGQVVFANQATNRNRRTREITQTGRILTTRTANTHAAIDEVLSAIEKKTRTYRSGTKLLLINMRRSEITMTEEWQGQLRVAVSARTDVPYESIYVATANTCFAC